MSTTEPERIHLAGAESLVPHSAPPSIDVLRVRVAGRRRRRSLVRRGAAGLFAVACVLLIATQLPERSNVADPVVPDESSVAVLPGSDSTPGDVAKAHNELNAHAPDSRTSSRLRLFARVRGHVPVLQIDRDAQRISVVGWVEAEQSIPVDLRYVPDRQQETFNAVLQGDSDPISL